MAEDTHTQPNKTSDIGQKQLRALVNLPLEERLERIAEGLPIILSSAETLYAASEQVGATGRVGQILRGHAKEEAAKILILLDYVRCPPGLSRPAQAQLNKVYDHGSRLIYAQACGWKPVDVEMLRGYVDHTRASHCVEGEYGEYILPNWDLYIREAQLYADLTRTDSGALVWNNPDDWPDDLDIFATTPTALTVTRALSRLGVFSQEGLRIVHDVWKTTPFRTTEDHAQSSALIQTTLERLMAQGVPVKEATGEDVQLLYRAWQIPMYDIDTKARVVDLETLREEQATHLNGLY